MNYKNYLAFTIFLIFFLLFLNTYSFNRDFNYKRYENKEISYVWVLSKNMYVDSNDLNKNLVVFKSNIDISSYNVSWKCIWYSNFLKNKSDLYFFEFSVIKNCLDWNFYLKDDKNVLYQTKFKINLFSKFKLIDIFTDYSTSSLLNLQEKINSQKSKFLFASVDNLDKNIDFIQKLRYLKELEYKENIINHIIEKRKDKYVIPVLNHYLPTKKTKLPNAERPYRKDYTFWIHEWWDIDTDFWQEVVAIDDWIIIRVVDDFKWNNFSKIKKNNLSYIDKLNNLDILRWNQVWLKTMKWDVIFYWHLDKVYKNIKVWDFVKAKTPLWTVGISWIPDKSYTDYHLHFELRKNPHLNFKIWKNTYIDYMKWDWYFKWKDRKYIIDNQYNIFKLN